MACFNGSIASILKVLRILSEKTNFKMFGRTIIESSWIARHPRRSSVSKNNIS